MKHSFPNHPWDERTVIYTLGIISFSGVNVCNSKKWDGWSGLGWTHGLIDPSRKPKRHLPPHASL